MQQREIKFRAWNALDSRPKERMVYGVYLNPEGEVCTPEGEYEKWPLMQFTGLKDKNGKEIYEGDILERGTKTKARKAVVWNDGKQNVPNQIGFNIGPKIKKMNWEVIGNIYETPELLTSSNS